MRKERQPVDTVQANETCEMVLVPKEIVESYRRLLAERDTVTHTPDRAEVERALANLEVEVRADGYCHVPRSKGTDAARARLLALIFGDAPTVDPAHLHYPFGWDAACPECTRKKAAFENVGQP